MWASGYKLVNTIILIGAVIGALVLFGNAINYLIPWQWLTAFFSILKYFSNAIDFMINTTQLWLAVGMVISVEFLYWGFHATMAIIKKLKA